MFVRLLFSSQLLQRSEKRSDMTNQGSAGRMRPDDEGSSPREIAPIPFLAAPSGPQIARILVGLSLRVPPETIGGSSGRARPALLARQLAIYLCHVALQLPLGEAGRLFGRDRTTAIHACHRVEDLRDDPQFDQALDRLERALGDIGTATELLRNVR